MANRMMLYGAGILTLLAGGAYLLSLNRLSAELEMVTRAMVHKVTLSGIDLRIDVTLKNPTGGKIKVKHPFVKLQHGEATFATSSVKDTDFELPKYGEKALAPLYLHLSFVSLATSAPSILKEYRASGKLSFRVKTVTTVNNRIPYSKTENITIGEGV